MAMKTAETTLKSKDLIGCKTKSNHRACCTIAMHFSMILWRSLVSDNIQFPNLKSTCSLLCQKYRRREKRNNRKIVTLAQRFHDFFFILIFECCWVLLPSSWLLKFHTSILLTSSFQVKKNYLNLTKALLFQRSCVPAVSRGKKIVPRCVGFT